jgi:hypothetical protein
MAYRRFRESPSSVVGCHVWDGLCESDKPADYYTITKAKESNRLVEIVCEYEANAGPGVK